MPIEQCLLESSVTAVLTKGGELVGTAFLYRKETDHCYWLTCHHVIARLEEIYLGNEFQGGPHGLQNWKNSVRAEYIESLSNISKDIVTVRTDVAEFLNAFCPLPLGFPDFKSSCSIKTIGFMPSHGNCYPYGEPIKGSFESSGSATFNPTSSIESDIQKYDNPWNCIHNQDITITVDQLSCPSTEIEGGLSGAPICIFHEQTGEFISCVGMLNNKARQPYRGKGTSIRFEDLYEAAGPKIPFFPYSNCVIVTLAAIQEEIQLDDNPYSTYHDANISVYYQDSRDKWQCFHNQDNQPVTVEQLLHSLEGEGTSFQIASDYIGHSEELLEYIRERQKPVLFLIDGVSMHVPELDEFFIEANFRYSDSSAYLLLLCERRYHINLRDVVREEIKDKLDRAWVIEPYRSLRKEVPNRSYFIDEFRELLPRISRNNDPNEKKGSLPFFPRVTDQPII